MTSLSWRSHLGWERRATSHNTEIHFKPDTATPRQMRKNKGQRDARAKMAKPPARVSGSLTDECIAHRLGVFGAPQ